MDIKNVAPLQVNVFAKVIYKDGTTKDLGLVYTDEKGWKGLKVKVIQRWRWMIWSLRKGLRL